RGQLCAELLRMRRARIRLREVMEEANRSLAVAAPRLRIGQRDDRLLAVRLVVDVREAVDGRVRRTHPRQQLPVFELQRRIGLLLEELRIDALRGIELARPGQGAG